MKPFLAALSLTLVLALGTISSAWSADLQRGRLAYGSWDHDTALRVFTTLSKQRNAEAQYSLAGMYEKGLGVTQDYTYALIWANSAA